MAEIRGALVRHGSSAAYCGQNLLQLDPEA
jgi:hypothetical protein